MAISTQAKSGSRPQPAEEGRRAENDQKAQELALSSDERVNETARRQLIEEEAYYRALRRGFAPGRELEDWLAAEAKVDLSVGETRVMAKSEFASSV